MTAPKTILGGDDVHAAVMDCGSWAVRFGSAGDDTPKIIFPSIVATRRQKSTDSTTKDVEMIDIQQSSSSIPGNDLNAEKVGQPSTTTTPLITTNNQNNPSLVAGDSILSAPHLFQDIQSIYSFNDSTNPATITNWNTMETLWKTAFSSLLLDSKEIPLMIVEPARTWQLQDRASALERAFESLNVPTAFIARGAATTAFASARTTACVLDIGYQSTSAIPVVDGYPLQKSMISTTAGGRYLNQQLFNWAERSLADVNDVDSQSQENKKQWLRAPHEIKKVRNISKDVLGEKEEVIKRHYDVVDLSMKEPWSNCTDTHRAFYRMRLIEEIKMASMTVSQSGADLERKQLNGNNGDSMKDSEDQKNSQDGSSMKTDTGKKESSGDKIEKDGKSKEKTQGSKSQEYVLPDGNVLLLNQNDGMNIGECLFTTNREENLVSLSEMVLEAVGNCDVDIRRDLFSGVVISGGSSMIPGIVERVSKELAIGIPQAYKLKVSASPNSIERTCGSWIGGSIVSSLGTFQQAWISKSEYDELGAVNALRKCP